MNNARRKCLREAISFLEKAKDNLEEAVNIVSICKDEEQECYDNLPSGVQDGERGDQMQTYIDSMDSFADDGELAYDSLDELIDTINEVVDD